MDREILRKTKSFLLKNSYLGLLRSSSHVLILLFLILSSRSGSSVLEVNPLSITSFAKMFSHPEGPLLIMLIVSLAVQSF